MSHARNTDPETSHAAAQGVTNSPGRSALQETICMLLYVFGPMTDNELCDQLSDRTPGTVIKRRTELAQAGIVEWTGTTRPTTTGYQARVWGLTPKAKATFTCHEEMT